MDPVSHALVGIAVSEATGMRGRIGRSANWLAALVGMAPDLDVLADRVSHDPWMSLSFHRGPTHGLIVAPLWAILFAGGFWLFRRRQFGAMFLLALIAVLLHPLLDVITSYGTQILWPFSNRRVAYDLLPIIDMLFTPLLLLTATACWIARRFSATGRPSRRIAVAGSLLAFAYVAAGFWADTRSRSLAANAPTDHGPAVEVRSVPQMGTIFARRLIARSPDGFYVARYNVLRSVGNPRWSYAPSQAGPAVAAADQLARIRLFRWFAMGQTRTTVDRAVGPDGRALVRVTYSDMRYGYPADSTESIFWAGVILDANTREVLVAPTGSRWAARDAKPTGPAAAFPPPANRLTLSGDRWSRIRAMWRDAWRE